MSDISVFDFGRILASRADSDDKFGLLNGPMTRDFFPVVEFHHRPRQLHKPNSSIDV
jgi:hypothetical protein